MPCSQAGSVKFRGLRADTAVGTDHDLVDTRLRLAQLRRAMPLQQRTTLIGLDRFVELAGPAFHATNDLLQLGERLLEAQLGNVGRYARLGHNSLQRSSSLY